MQLDILQFIAGIALLLWSADRLITYSITVAAHFRLPAFIIGSTIVALGTSAPEICVSVAAALNDNAMVAVGNVIGSNIANIGFLLGISLCICPKLLHTDGYTIGNAQLLLGITTATWILCLFFALGYIVSAMLLSGFGVFMYYTIKHGRENKAVATTAITSALWPTVLYLVIALILLAWGAGLVANSAVKIARELAISEFIIGSTVVALSTSLPEFITALISALKKQHALALGNIIGSNILNNTIALGCTGILAPSVLPAHVLSRDFPILFAVTLLLLLLLKRVPKN
ncbi:MAG: calcium/sodium antiporter [Thiotrichales bacterium]|nr:MAG: calcium/sodium antiporter [Thiotrichales bacterium]